VVLPALKLADCGVSMVMPAGADMTMSGSLQAGVSPAPPLGTEDAASSLDDVLLSWFSLAICFSRMRAYTLPASSD
jgi:magnesium-transporting ATPase (P-type)